MESGELSPEMQRKGKGSGFKEGEGEEKEEGEGIRRRLSVANPFEGIDGIQDDWEDANEDPARSA